jgi:predicted nucleotidyltransferase component of viral defense system
MIGKREILDTAVRTGLNPSVVEKDYALGWALAGIFAHPEIAGSWVFKGGTCLKKCYFETYRFSEARCARRRSGRASRAADRRCWMIQVHGS